MSTGLNTTYSVVQALLVLPGPRRGHNM